MSYIAAMYEMITSVSGMIAVRKEMTRSGVHFRWYLRMVMRRRCCKAWSTQR